MSAPVFFLERFRRPEYLLASKITSVVMLALVSVVAVSASFGWIMDERRVEMFFEHRIAQLSMRGGEFPRIVTQAPRRDFESRIGERRFLPQNLRNFAVAYPDGNVSIVWSLESEGIPPEIFTDLPLGKVFKRDVSGEGYVWYAVRIGQDRTLLLYEPEDSLIGPRLAVFSSLVLGILAFSVALFFISLSFARRVIRPIEELAERERAYARHIAHELKTPLAVAKSDLQLAVVDPSWTAERISSAIAEIGAMRDTVDDLLLLSASGGSLSQNDEDLAEILSDAVEKSGVPERFRIIRDADAVTVVRSDKRLVGTIFRNLVSNSLIHAPSDALVTVRFSRGGFSFSNAAPDADPKVVSRAFEAFVGTPGKGSGIGLSLVRRIAEAHGWKISMKLLQGDVTVSVFY